MTTKLKVSHLYKIYGPRPQEALTSIKSGLDGAKVFASTGHVVAVDDVSFSVASGEIFTIMGLSGSGKSTLVRCLNRIIEPTAGSIEIDGENIVEKSRTELRALRRGKVAMVFQGFALLPHKTVLENVEFGLLIRGDAEPVRRKKAREAIERVGLGGWESRYPEALSGGMKQRVGLARALASDPNVLLMDEPFSALDPLIRSELQQELLKLQRDIKKTIIFITHDFQEAVRLSDHLAVMREGKFVQVGTSHDIVLRPVDDYVGTFSRDLDRTRILSAGDVAYMRVPVVSHDSPARTALDEMRRHGKPHILVADASRKPLGYVNRADIEGAGDLNNRTALQFKNGDAITVPRTTNLVGVYALLDGRGPLAVLDEGGAIVGGIDEADVVKQLADVAREERDSADDRPKVVKARAASDAMAEHA